MRSAIFNSFIFMLAASVLVCQENGMVFESVRQQLAKYRQEIYPDDLTIQQGTLRLQIAGRRTNYRSMLLLGFFTVGRTISTMDISLVQIELVVLIDMRAGQRVSASASPEQVIGLARGRIGAEHFFQQIGF